MSGRRAAIDTTLCSSLNSARLGRVAIATGTTLDFLMQQGDQRPLDKVDVFKGVFGSGQTAPPNLSALTHVQNGLSVGAANGGATVPQFSIVTNTSVANPIEWIAIRADCTYLLLNQITDPSPGVPEPRFYGLLMAGLLSIAGIWADAATRQPRASRGVRETS
jgi:hypothetical protein